MGSEVAQVGGLPQQIDSILSLLLCEVVVLPSLVPLALVVWSVPGSQIDRRAQAVLEDAEVEQAVFEVRIFLQRQLVHSLRFEDATVWVALVLPWKLQRLGAISHILGCS